MYIIICKQVLVCNTVSNEGCDVIAWLAVLVLKISDPLRDAIC